MESEQPIFSKQWIYGKVCIPVYISFYWGDSCLCILYYVDWYKLCISLRGKFPDVITFFSCLCCVFPIVCYLPWEIYIFPGRSWIFVIERNKFDGKIPALRTVSALVQIVSAQIANCVNMNSFLEWWTAPKLGAGGGGRGTGNHLCPPWAGRHRHQVMGLGTGFARVDQKDNSFPSVYF